MKGGITKMPSVKTAISIQEPLFKEVEALARQMKISRSQLFVKAVEEFLQHHRNRQLLEQINRAYADGPDPEEEEYLEAMRKIQLKLVKGTW